MTDRQMYFLLSNMFSIGSFLCDSLLGKGTCCALGFCYLMFHVFAPKEK